MKPAQKITLAVLLLLFAAVKILLLLWWQGKQSTVHALPCNPAAEGCRFDGTAHLRLTGADPHRPFAATVSGLPPHTQSVSLSFAMRGMDMGFNRFDLHRDPNGIWRNDTLRLPVCSLSRHDWIAEWTVDGKRYQADFQTQQ
ncbi:hypothetical protein [Conchiformibius kuhniae]|uniref:Uncharacterized protein n=1 Tax=Conchiformibius kuhniae TaxID=211502 RepID=A0A8T9MYQ4_9NEIS|nr:hypothetical protein [Conchiformibius kuhniae]UOP04963.1 hypothetical protein LVJ77_01050 [Conchiformibius kuhniae]